MGGANFDIADVVLRHGETLPTTAPLREQHNRPDVIDLEPRGVPKHLRSQEHPAADARAMGPCGGGYVSRVSQSHPLRVLFAEVNCPFGVAATMLANVDAWRTLWEQLHDVTWVEFGRGREI